MNLKSVAKYLVQCLKHVVEVPNSQDATQQIRNESEKLLEEVRGTIGNDPGNLNQVPPELLLRIIKIIKQFGDSEKKYEIASSFLLSAAEHLIKISLNQVEEESNETEKFIEDTIIEQIVEHKSNLVQLKSFIEGKFHKLSAIDEAYIERKYIENCLNLWWQESKELLKSLSKRENRADIEGIYNSLDAIQDLSQIPHPLNELNSYLLLMEHYYLVREEDKNRSLLRFKKDCLEQLVAYNDSAMRRLALLEALINVLSDTKDIHPLIAKLELRKFHRGDLSFDGLISNIVELEDDFYSESENLRDLKNVANSIKEDNDVFLIDKFKEAIAGYLESIIMERKTIDGRQVLEVTKRKIVLSEILDELESILMWNQPKVEEVRFIAPDIIHVDADLKNVFSWRGKNIVVYTKTLKIHNQVKWDVSGRDEYHEFPGNAGTGDDGHGMQGSDGFKGESGGNVLILAEKILNPTNFTITSNGGFGGTGEDGGDGADGADGKGIERAHFYEKFPNIPPVFVDGMVYVDLITSNIQNMASAKILKRDQGLKGRAQIWRSVFIEAETPEESNIFFSGYYEPFSVFTRDVQSFLLHKGSLGKPGGDGGEYGLGGQGGFPGEIVIGNADNLNQQSGVKIFARQGNDGEAGRGGHFGYHGKNGWDMGFIEYWGLKHSKFYGADENSKLELRFHSDLAMDRVWSQYYNSYVSIEPSNIEHNKQKTYKERKTSRRSHERQRHATKKKTISQSSVLANYSHQFSVTEKNVILDLKSEMESNKQLALQAIFGNREQQNEQTMQLKIKERISITYPSRVSNTNNNTVNVSSTATGSDEPTADILITELQMLSLDGLQPIIDIWYKLKAIELSLPQLKQLFSFHQALSKHHEEIRESSEGSKLQYIGEMLINKYRYATLQEIVKQLPFHKNAADNADAMTENASRYLMLAVENDNNIVHPSLGALNEYLFDYNRSKYDKICEFCRDEWQTVKNKALESSIRAFVLEVGQSEETHHVIKQYHKRNAQFLEMHKECLKIYFDPFKSELSRPRHQEKFNLWIESFKDRSLARKFEEEIQKDAFLKELYNRFNNQLKHAFNWDECCQDQVVVKEFYDYICKKGPTSNASRELLAYAFDISIRSYVEAQENGLFLRANHNPSSGKIIHILQKWNEFKQLNIDKDFFKLEAGRRQQAKLYAKILEEIESFDKPQDLDAYLQKEPYLLENFISRDFKPSRASNDVQAEEEFIEQITEYFPEEEKQKLKLRLENIAVRSIGEQGIIQDMLLRFNSEGKRVRFKELCYLLRVVLSAVVEGWSDLSVFRWIVTAHPQKEWVNELILLQLENHFKKELKEKVQWRECLSKIDNKDILLLLGTKLVKGGTVSLECVGDIFYLTSTIQNGEIALEELELSEWPYALKEKYWTYKLSIVANWEHGDLPTASYYILSIENIFGTILAEELLKVLAKHNLSASELSNILSNFHEEKWNLSQEELRTVSTCSISEWVNRMQEKFVTDRNERTITQLVELIKSNANTSKVIQDSLPKIADSVQKINNKGRVVDGKPLDSFTANDIKQWTKTVKRSIHEKKQSVDESREEMLAVIDRANKIKNGFYLRETQKLSTLALLVNNHNTLAQVATGEGKTSIVVAMSIIKALCGERVHIITSSSVLAKRDAEETKELYNLFDINVSHNCSESVDERRQAYSANQIVYGDLSNFQRDYLLDRFYGKNILGDHDFSNVIVDEVDSMLLDKGNNTLYLSHDLPGFEKLESVYIYIWQWINRPGIEQEEVSYALDVEAIKDAVLNDLHGVIKLEDISKLGSELSKQQTTDIWERLIAKEVLDQQGKLLKKNYTDNELKAILPPAYDDYRDCLKHLLIERVERDNCIHVPNYLKPFIELHLESWIKSAISAFVMRAGEDYVVDVDKTGTSPDRNPNITIIDRDTGTDQANSQWDEALHQFIQLKHGCKISLMSLKAVFISNVSYFKLYNRLYGLTGTLGSKIERDMLQDVHGVNFITVPTFRFKQFVEYMPIVCTSEEEWIKKIHDETVKLTKKRSVLIICETIHDVRDLCEAFRDVDPKTIHTYTRDYEKIDKGFSDVEGSKKLGPGQIIIATNLAGRGTDIKLTDELKKAKGLHVCISYLPDNDRIEQQAFGRAARMGDEGSGQLIIVDSRGQKNKNAQLQHLKKERDIQELHRVSEVKAYYKTQITTEESYFAKFKEQYEQMTKKLKDKKVPDEVQKILLQSCLDKWTLWLDEHSKSIGKLTDEQGKRAILNQLDKFILDLKRLGTDSISWSAWVTGNLAHMIALGKYLSLSAHDSAMQLFNEIIAKEPHFSEAAHYYKAFALARINGLENVETKNEFKKELREAAKLFNERSRLCVLAAAIVDNLKKKHKASILQIDAYKEQQENLANLYDIFSRSIDDILGHAVTPQSLVSSDIGDTLVSILYDDLLREGVLEDMKVKKSVSEEELKVVCCDYGISTKTLRYFLSTFEIVNNTEFFNLFGKHVPLPCRNEFWDSLIEQKMLCQEVEFVLINNETMQEVDPSLSDALSGDTVLKKLILESDNKEIYLNAECISFPDTDSTFYIKDDFIHFVGNRKFEALREKKVCSVNKKARVDKSIAGSVSFSRYDSISLDDFGRINICRSEAEKILAELVQQNIIMRDVSGNTTYKLKSEFDEIENLELPFCPVYENAVKGLLNICFTYRKALQRMLQHLDDDNLPVRLQLFAHPHHNLLFELLEQNVVTPVTVSTNGNGTSKSKLNSIYNRTFTIDYLKLILSRSKLIPEEYVEKGFEYIKEQGMEKTMQKILDNHAKLAKSGTINRIASILDKLKGTIHTLEAPSATLRPLNDILGQGEFGNIEEVHIFSLNGLTQLIELEEKRWTVKMLLNSAIVTVLGIVQIIIGTVVELFSVGLLTHVGGALIDEGVSDLFFAAYAFTTGYFSWEEYGRHKLESIILSVATAGVGAFLSRGAKVSRFGYKLVGSSFEVGGKKLAETSGAKLIQAAGARIVGREVVKRIVKKATEGLVLSFASAGIDELVENHLRELCESIASAILTDMEGEVESHNISDSLEKAYKMLGEERAELLVNDLTTSFFEERNFWNEFSSQATQIASSVVEGIGNAVKKTSFTDNKLTLPIRAITLAVVWSDRVSQIARVRFLTKNFLNKLDDEIKDRLNNHRSANHDQKNANNFESFKTNVINLWKSSITEKATQIIGHRIVGPILYDATRHLIKHVGRSMKQKYRAFKESGYFDSFEKFKQKYARDVQNERLRSTSSNTENVLTKIYHKDLLKLLSRTRNPKLFANIVRENIPMDLTCVDACVHVVHKILKEQGIDAPRLVITVEGEGGIKQKFSTTSSSADEINVKLRLKENHFQVFDNNSTENGSTDSKNNCLYEALTEAIPGLGAKIAAREFRDRLANYIEHDAGIQFRIQQGWHWLPISIGALGGAKNKDTEKPNRVNEEAEAIFPYQHDPVPGKVKLQGWKFNADVDVDIRQAAELSERELNLQLTQAHNVALDKIKQRLGAISDNPPSISLDKFKETIYDTVLVIPKSGKTITALFPTEMETVVDVKPKDMQQTVKYALKIDLDNPHELAGLQGPHGPHVGYEVTRQGKKGPDSITGHILINKYEDMPDRGRGMSHDDSSLEKYDNRIKLKKLFQPFRDDIVINRTYR